MLKIMLHILSAVLGRADAVSRIIQKTVYGAHTCTRVLRGQCKLHLILKEIL